MIISITYGDEKYNRSKKFNCKMALKHGADLAIAYGPEDISENYKRENEHIWMQPRGGGYWIWKPYIINMAMENMEDNDYLIYTDAGAIFVRQISFLIDAMEAEKTDIMVFSLKVPEKYYTKRDAFLLMECDEPAYTDTFQTLGGYIVLKKTERTMNLMRDFLKYIQDERIVTDIPNQLGKENYEGFVENRHDQTCLSLLCKKYGIQPFRDPSQYGLAVEAYPKDVQRRSPYPQVIDSFRDASVGNLFQLKYRNEKWYRFVSLKWYKYKGFVLKVLRHVKKLTYNI